MDWDTISSLRSKSTISRKCTLGVLVDLFILFGFLYPVCTSNKAEQKETAAHKRKACTQAAVLESNESPPSIWTPFGKHANLVVLF